MATTVHIPKPLLERIDRRAQARNISRNRYIVEALSRTLDDETDWPPGFIDRLRQRGRSKELVEAVEELRGAVAAGRRSKSAPPEL